MSKKGADTFASKFAFGMGFGMIGSWLASLSHGDPGWLSFWLAAIAFFASWAFGVRAKG